MRMQQAPAKHASSDPEDSTSSLNCAGMEKANLDHLLYHFPAELLSSIFNPRKKAIYHVTRTCHECRSRSDKDIHVHYFIKKRLCRACKNTKYRTVTVGTAKRKYTITEEQLGKLQGAKVNKLQKRRRVLERRKLREEQKLAEKQAASKLSAVVLGWHSQAARNCGNGQAAWERFSQLDAFKPETQQDTAHTDSAHTNATHTEALHMIPELTEATHTEALHMTPALMGPADEPCMTDSSSMAVDEASLTAHVQNSTEADGTPETAAVVTQKRGRSTGSRNKHSLVTTADTLSTVSKVGTGAGTAADTSATGLACGAVARTGCKQPPSTPRQTPAGKCKLKVNHQLTADGANVPEGAQLKTRVRILAPPHKRQRLGQTSPAAQRDNLTGAQPSAVAVDTAMMMTTIVTLASLMLTSAAGNLTPNFYHNSAALQCEEGIVISTTVVRM